MNPNDRLNEVLNHIRDKHSEAIPGVRDPHFMDEIDLISKREEYGLTLDDCWGDRLNRDEYDYE